MKISLTGKRSPGWREVITLSTPKPPIDQSSTW